MAFDMKKWDRMRKQTKAILKNCKKGGELIVVDFKKKKVIRKLKIVNGG